MLVASLVAVTAATVCLAGFMAWASQLSMPCLNLWKSLYGQSQAHTLLTAQAALLMQAAVLQKSLDVQQTC